ncbi:hypothetical protein PR048_031022 [Dryococelus australis]|uniref:Uncharacterized protein n=1 Tax=Dryococelus australis TaxID=614101 RepID=A0ABQ9G878_9NEOP|nr:hypothetical protein PR048_031022 [Dryococelus australis]
MQGQGGKGDPRGNPLTSGIVQNDYHVRKKTRERPRRELNPVRPSAGMKRQGKQETVAGPSSPTHVYCHPRAVAEEQKQGVSVLTVSDIDSSQKCPAPARRGGAKFDSSGGGGAGFNHLVKHKPSVTSADEVGTQCRQPLPPRQQRRGGVIRGANHYREGLLSAGSTPECQHSRTVGNRSSWRTSGNFFGHHLVYIASRAKLCPFSHPLSTTYTRHFPSQPLFSLATATEGGSLQHRGSKLDPRADLRSTQKTVAPFEFRTGLEIEMKFVSKRRNWRFQNSIRDQQPSATNMFVHWLLPQRVASVTPHLAVCDSLLVSLQDCRVVQDVLAASCGKERSLVGAGLVRRREPSSQRISCQPSRAATNNFLPYRRSLIFDVWTLIHAILLSFLLLILSPSTPFIIVIRDVENKGLAEYSRQNTTPVYQWREEVQRLAHKGDEVQVVRVITVRIAVALTEVSMEQRLNARKRESPEKARRPAASSGTLHLYMGPATTQHNGIRWRPARGSGANLVRIPAGLFPDPHVEIVPDDAAGRRVFSGLSCFRRPCTLALLHARLASPSSALKTSMLRTGQISSFTLLVLVSRDLQSLQSNARLTPPPQIPIPCVEEKEGRKEGRSGGAVSCGNRRLMARSELDNGRLDNPISGWSSRIVLDQGAWSVERAVAICGRCHLPRNTAQWLCCSPPTLANRDPLPAL